MARLLDLFCGAGGAAVGYARAGFEIVGVDNRAQPNYPFPFILGDGLEVGRAIADRFDVIHASPPCQAYSTLSNRYGSTSATLIAETRRLLEATGRPWVLENVTGAIRELRSPVQLTGTQFGLGTHRPRLFESNRLLLVPPAERRPRDGVPIYGKPDGRWLWKRNDGSMLRGADLATGSAAMGVDWMTWPELVEAVPPAYTEHIGRLLIGGNL